MNPGKGGTGLLAGLLLFILAGLPQPARAQIAQGRLVDRTTELPVDGALVLLSDSAGTMRTGSLTDEDGLFLIRAPAPGRFFLAAYRIGFETTTSEFFGLSRGEAFDIQLETRMSPIELSELKIEVESRCVVRPEEGLELARAWEEARKALTVQEWAEGEDLLLFRAISFQREMDPESNLILSETRQVREGLSSNPVRSRPAEDLVSKGFVRPVEGGRFDYFGTDASVLLSDPFLDTHCFRFRTSAESPDLIGLSFEPVRSQRPPDIEGTLWLDRTTARLRLLEFTYDWAPWEAAAGVAVGRVEFQELPNGAWAIPRWWIRMPTLTVDYPPEEESQPIARVIGTLEVGWEVQQISTLDGRVVAPQALGSVRGLVRDDVSRVPLRGKRVVLSGTSYTAITREDGSFAMEGVAEGGYAVSVMDPLLDSLGISPRGEEIHVRASQATEIRLDIPSRSRILQALCGAFPGEVRPAVLAGVARLMGTGAPVAGAEVTLEWREGGSRRGRTQRLQVTADGAGRYRACGVPAGIPIDVWATTRDARSPVERVKARAGEVIFLDLWTDRDQGPGDGTR